MLAGHANGEVNLWEFKRTGWEAVKAIKDAHASAVTCATFVEGTANLALTADAKGRLVSHNVSAYLSITSIFAGMQHHWKDESYCPVASSRVCICLMLSPPVHLLHVVAV